MAKFRAKRSTLSSPNWILRNLEEGSTFCDLGSGTGQLTAYAALVGFEQSIGIEIRPEVHQMVQIIWDEMKAEITKTGQSFGVVEYVNGSFLETGNSRKITECDVLFSNNFIFDEELTQQMEKEVISNMSHGAVIITTRSICKAAPLTHNRVNRERPSSYLDVEELVLPKGSASWSDSPLTIYVHRVNWEKLSEFLATLGGESEVEVLGQRTIDGAKQYLIKWRGYASLFNSWIDVDDMKAKEKIKGFKMKTKNQ